MKKIGILFGLLFLISITVNAQIKKLKWMDGIWKGKAYQIDNTTFDVVLNYYHKEGKINVSYPSLKCTGVWKFIDTDKCKYEFLENKTYGNCDDNVEVIVTQINESIINVVYFLPSYMKGPIAYGVLEREK